MIFGQQRCFFKENSWIYQKYFLTLQALSLSMCGQAIDILKKRDLRPIYTACPSDGRFRNIAVSIIKSSKFEPRTAVMHERRLRGDLICSTLKIPFLRNIPYPMVLGCHKCSLTQRDCAHVRQIRTWSVLMVRRCLRKSRRPFFALVESPLGGDNQGKRSGGEILDKR